ncbi:ELMO domain-containing 1 [Brachionus plicatilis]|uniref:ELMO domain-containing 1 n=1 Tax=Brachionus plicatilis TaxID=10195 RepID=A0A3M7T1U6_BRAPC|nr:ELMO domain-containing 1 [Brachionus plicatilis]
MNSPNKASHSKYSLIFGDKLQSFLHLVFTQFLLHYFDRMSKFILHLITGKSELERICKNEKIQSVRIKKIENSLKKSSNSYLRNLTSSDSVSSGYEDDIVFNIMQIKQIPAENATFSFLMKDALMKIKAYHSLMREVDLIRCEKFCHENWSQLSLLLDLWTGLKSESGPECVKNRKWRELGFQGDDPSTDFRGMGMLALNSLNYLVTKHNEIAKNIFAKSKHPKYGYSFAIVGINVIAWVYKLLIDGDLKTHFYNYSQFLKKDKIKLENFYRIFVSVFIEFNEFWFYKEPDSIMQFELLSKEFLSLVKLKLVNEPYTHITEGVIDRRSFVERYVLNSSS